MNKQINVMSRPASGLLAGGLAIMLSGPAMALDIAQLPIYLPTPLAPNIVLTFDDSGSMAWAAVPDNIAGWGYTNTGVKNSRRWKSAHFNPLYYNPNVTYTPPVDANGNPLTTSFTAAWRNGFDPSRGSVDLSNSYRPMDVYSPTSNCSNPSTTTCNYVQHPSADFANTTANTTAYYYVFNAALPGCDGSKNDDDCYQKVTVSATSGPGGTDERQNFANWYSFYRTRNLMTVTAAARAFASVGGNVRLAWQALNTCNAFSTNCQGWTSTQYDNRIRTFQGTHRSNFYNWLFRLPASGATPLRTGLKRAGEYFGTAGVNSPYAFDPQVTANPEYSCRPNFSIVMTDGIWNSDSLSSYGNADNTGKTLPDGKTYSPAVPYRDNNSNSLADIAFHYWATDLRGDLDNNLVPYMPDRTGNANQQYWSPKNDPATWQHMVTFTMGLGLSGWLGSDWTGDTHGGPFYTGLLAGTQSWPTTGANQAPGNVYDLWHAAINGRGRFFSAEDPAGLIAAFQQALNRVMERQSSASALATNSTRLSTETVVFQARFDSADWSGQLLALPLNSDGSIGTTLWDAAEQIPAASARNIKTWNGTAGVDFSWSSLNTTQQTQLGSAAVLAYLRGDPSGEQRNGGSYRNRNRRLGDIVNSDPVFVGTQNFGYEKLSGAEGNSYKTFVANKASRPKMLYVGANDGMLHGFDASTGAERLAYIPNEVFPNLSSLATPGYTHRYFVDASPWVGDAYFQKPGEASPTWRSVLVGGTGAGGKAVFALDVSDPAAFGTSHVLWEFTHSQLGYTLGQPMIARLNNGRWAAVFGNGYNSTGGTAKLFIVYLDANAADGWQAGADFVILDTNSTTANGLSSPTLYDQNGDRVVDYVYAGDLQGNVWKFDLSSSNASQWKVANKSGSNNIPFFTARNASNQAQPITGQIEIGPAPPGKAGVMLYFGTGRFFATGDNTDTQVQSFYALWDSYTNNNEITYSCSGSSCNRNSILQQQSVLYEGSGPGSNNVRVSSTQTVDYNSQRGWYLDLLPPSGTAHGERVVSAPLLRHNRVIFTTPDPVQRPLPLRRRQLDHGAHRPQRRPAGHNAVRPERRQSV